MLNVEAAYRKEYRKEMARVSDLDVDGCERDKSTRWTYVGIRWHRRRSLGPTVGHCRTAGTFHSHDRPCCARNGRLGSSVCHLLTYSTRIRMRDRCTCI